MKKHITSILLFCFISATAQEKVKPSAQFKVTGDIKKGKTYSVTDLQTMQSVSIGDLIIRNHKGDSVNVAKNMKGVMLTSVLDNVTINATSPKELSACYFVLIATDGYRNVYSWNELYNTDVGKKVYLVTEKEHILMNNMDESILVISLSDFVSGRRFLKSLDRIEVRKSK